ncbi:MAG: Uncharacterized protein CEN87_654, partial [Parcubacteria group bacterium Licking1014_1]
MKVISKLFILLTAVFIVASFANIVSAAQDAYICPNGNPNPRVVYTFNILNPVPITGSPQPVPQLYVFGTGSTPSFLAPSQIGAYLTGPGGSGNYTDNYITISVSGGASDVQHVYDTHGIEAIQPVSTPIDISSLLQPLANQQTSVAVTLVDWGIVYGSTGYDLTILDCTLAPPPVCTTNSQCGTNGYIESPFCQSGNVFQNYKTYTCNNPGATNSNCTNLIQTQLRQTCSTNQTCSNGACVNVTIACNANSDCGISGYTGSPYCQGGDVYQNYKTYVCHNSGTADSVCTNVSVSQLKQNCGQDAYTSNYRCSGNIVQREKLDKGCSINACFSNSVWENYQTCSASQTCSNAQCVNNSLSLISSSAPASVYIGDNFQIKCNFGINNLPCIAPTHGGKGCAFVSFQGNGAVFNCVAEKLGLQANTCNIFSYPQDSRCTPVQTNSIQSTNVLDRCASHSTKQCVGSIVYWYNSCGVREDIFQQCAINQTCQNAQCINIACSTNSQCGTNGFTGSPYCQGGDVFQNYKT